MATEKNSGTTKKVKRPAAGKKRATRTSAPKAVTEAAAPAEPAAAPNPDRLTEVARTIGSTMGAIAATTKRAFSRSAGKK